MADNLDPLLVDPALLRQAEQVCQRRLSREPDDVEALRALVDVHRKGARLAEAVAGCEHVLRLDPDDGQARYLRAVLAGERLPTPPTGVRPAPFVLLPHALPPDFHEGLLPFLAASKDAFAPAPVTGPSGVRQYDPSLRDTLDFKGHWDARARFKAHVYDLLPDILPRLGMAPFTPGLFDLHVRAYLDGHFFKVHTDTRRDRPDIASRVVTVVYYLHRTPRAYTGGALLLFDTDPDTGRFTRSRFTQIVPEDGTLVAFPSHAYHCVTPVRCASEDFGDSRFVLNAFIHASEPSHG